MKTLRLLALGRLQMRTRPLLSLDEAARRVAQQLVAADVGRRPVVFVTHSMGGLLVKQLLTDAIGTNVQQKSAATARIQDGTDSASPTTEATSTAGPYRQLVDACRGVVFIATPHHGSPLGTLRKAPGRQTDSDELC